MKVLVHLSRHGSESFLIDFGDSVKNEEIDELVERHQKDAAESLYGYACLLSNVRKTRVTPRQIRVVERQCDRVVAGPEIYQLSS